jgi:ankyrin repeat protein
MKRIEGQHSDSQELARQVLAWILYAKRPLTTLELQHALAVEVGKCKFDENNLPEIEDIILVCAGLVTVDKESNTIRLIHDTTQQYFERTQNLWFPDAQRVIATVCVTYLLFDVFEVGFCSADTEFETRLRLNAFFSYSARNWGYHVREAPAEMEQLVLEFLSSEGKVFSSSQAMMAFGDYSGYSQRVPRRQTGVHLTAYFGLAKVMIALLKNGHQPDLKDTYGRTPLSWAAEEGHEAVVRLLLVMDDVNSDSKDTYCQTPLSWAAGNGHEAVVRLLLAHNGVDPDSKDKYGQTPLSRAAGNGHEAVIKLLLTRAAVDPELKDYEHGRTALSWAAEKGHEAVVKLLLAHDSVDADSKDKYGQTPLSWAALTGHEQVVKLLLAKDGVEADSRDTEYGLTPLSWAARNGHEAVIRLLVENGVDPDSKDKYGQTPLSRAAENGHDAVVKLLLTKNAVAPESKDALFGRTPLSWAAENEHEAVIRLLVEKSFSINADGTALLETALTESYIHIVELLVAEYIDWVAQDKFEWLLELKDAGFDVPDIVPLLFKAMNKNPWIPFERPNINMSNGKVNVNFHQPSCAHHGRSGNRKDDPLFDPVTFHLKRDAMQGRVAALCGLAGVYPPFQDENDDLGYVSFTGTKASITFNSEKNELEIEETQDNESTRTDMVL